MAADLVSALARRQDEEALRWDKIRRERAKRELVFQPGDQFKQKDISERLRCEFRGVVMKRLPDQGELTVYLVHVTHPREIKRYKMYALEFWAAKLVRIEDGK